LQVIDTTSEFFEQEKLRQRAERDRERAQDLRERLTIGENLDSKDARWLSRYEAQLERAAQAAEAGQVVSQVVVDDEASGSEVAMGESLETSAAPFAEKGDMLAESVDDLEQGIEPDDQGDDPSDELTAKMDYDDSEAAGFDDMDADDSEVEGRDRDADGRA
jgi:segregation and condensation protein B